MSCDGSDVDRVVLVVGGGCDGKRNHKKFLFLFFWTKMAYTNLVAHGVVD